MSSGAVPVLTVLAPLPQNGAHTPPLRTGRTVATNPKPEDVEDKEDAAAESAKRQKFPANIEF